jgi:dimethylargininase
MTAPRFRHAIVRPPCAAFASGLTTSGLGPPDLERARDQHARYADTLTGCGIAVTHLADEPAFPDGTFVEDTAVLTGRGAVLCRPGAPSRQGEIAAIREAVMRVCPVVGEITSPGTVDGGDVCEAGSTFFIGLSGRTNAEGARQLAAILGRVGYAAVNVDVRESGMLHLKSGIAWLGGTTLLGVEPLASSDAFAGCDVVRVDCEEAYAANCVALNGKVLLASGFPKIERALRDRGHDVVLVPMSEFQKMDGGLSCLSLRC